MRTNDHILPHLPNKDSRHKTPRSQLFDLHWCKLGVHRRWSDEQFIRLANFCNLTPYELASYVGIPHREIERFLERGGRLVGPAAIWLSFVEHQLIGSLTNNTVAVTGPPLHDSPAPDQKVQAHAG